MKKHIDVAEMVNRFLAWKLPHGFAPDGGISFKPSQNGEHAFWPIGTNLLTAEQARQMFEHCLGEALAQPQGEWVDLTDDEILTAANVSQEDIYDLDLLNVLSDVRAIIAKFKEKNTPPVAPQGKQQDVNQIEAMVNLHDAAFVRGFAAGKLYGQANPEPQEPVAWMLEQGDVVEFEYRDYHENSEWTPLYTAPPSAALPVPDHLPDATKKVGCAYCDNPLFAGTKCNNCGRVTLALPVQEPSVSDGLCGGCAKKAADGWALYCVECWEKGNGQSATNEPAANAHVSNSDSDSLSYVKQEPVAWATFKASELSEIAKRIDADDSEGIDSWSWRMGALWAEQRLQKLNAAPVLTKDMTDDEISDAIHGKGSPLRLHDYAIRDFRAVIAADREKNRG